MKYFRQLFISLFFISLTQTSFAQSSDVIAQILADSAELYNNKRSLPFIKEAFNLCRNRDCADSTIARLYQRKSVAYYYDYIDDYKALSFSDSSVYFFTRAYGEKHIMVANAIYNNGILRKEIIDAKSGIEQIDKALEITNSIRSVLRRQQVDSMLVQWNSYRGNFCMSMGDNNSALVSYQKALKNVDTNPKREKPIMRQLIRLYGNLGMINEAIKNYKKFIVLNNNKTDYISSVNMGVMYLDQEDPQSAAIFLHSIHRDLTQLAKESSISTKLKSRLSNSHANLAQLNTLYQNWNQAEYHFQKGIQLLREYDPTLRTSRFGELFLKKARIEYGQNKFISSMNYLDSALLIVAPGIASSNIQENLTLLGNFKYIPPILHLRTRVHRELEQLEEALEDVALLNRIVAQNRRTYATSMSKYFLLSKVMPTYELGIQTNYELYQQTGDKKYLEDAYTLNAQNKAILLLESLQNEYAMRYAGVPESVQEEEAARRRSLADAEKALYQSFQKEGDLVDSLQQIVGLAEQEYYTFLQKVERDYPSYYQLKYSADRPPQVSTIQDKLAEDQHLLEYFVGQDSIYTFLIDQEQFQLFTTALPTGFTDSVELLREFLTNGIERDCEQQYIQLNRFFYQLLLAPALAHIPTADQRLVIIPDGLLNFVSFEALLTEDVERLRGASSTVLEQYACSYAYSSRLLIDETFASRDATKGFAGFGMEYDDHTLQYINELALVKETTFDNTLVTLPCGQAVDTTRALGKLTFSDDEVRAISQITGGDSWLNEQVTKQIFLNEASDYNILHLAMHGSYDLTFPMNSSLIFTRADSSDVFLRAAEIYNMNLSGDLAVLSACNTAYGKLQAGEGPMTLARAFHYAGIPSVVATLWSIPDNSASKIMELFYHELQAGYPKDVALRRAKLAYLANDDLSSPGTRQPIHWAPAVVIGSVAPISSGGIAWYWWALGGVLLISVLAILGRLRIGVSVYFDWHQNTR